MSAGAVVLGSSPSGKTAVLMPCPGADADDVEEALHRAGRTAARCVVVDLQHVRTVDWDLFDVVLAEHDRLERAGRRLLLVNVLPGPALALTLMDTGRQLTVVTLERVLSTAWSETGSLDP